MPTPRLVRLLAALVATAGLGLGSPAAYAAAPAAAFDLDGDGYADLAVGARGEKVGGRGFAGAVGVLPGSSAGPSATGNQLWSLDSSGVAGRAESGDIFGSVVASGDFDRDGRADLAVGVPQKKVNGRAEAGAVSVLYGSASGLVSRRNQLWSQDSAGVPGNAEQGDRFGSSVVAGDFNRDGYADLAIGVPFEVISGSGSGGGLVNVLYGSASGLRGKGAQAWTQDSPGVRGSTETDDRFGATLAAADVTGDSSADLAVGVPHENGGSGAVQLLLGGRKGLTATGNQLWSQSSDGVIDDEEGEDGFASSLTFGDFDRDGHADLAVGVPGEVVQDCFECSTQGAVQVLLGTGSGLTAVGNQFWHIGSPGLPGDVTGFNDFGSAVVSGDFDGDGAADLAVAADLADVDGRSAAGQVYVLAGAATSGLHATDLVITQNTPGVPDEAENGDGIFMTLAAHRYLGGTRDALAIGYPQESVGDVSSAGVVIVVPGSATGLDPAASRLWSQDSPGIRDSAESSDQFGLVSG